MIFILVWLITLPVGAADQLNTSNGAVHLRGPFQKTAYPGILRHVDSERSVDLRPFGARTATVCDLMLSANQVLLNEYRGEEPDLMNEVDLYARARRAHAYGVLTIRLGPHTILTRADPYRPDQLFAQITFLGQVVNPRLPLTGGVTEHLAAMARVIGRLDPWTTGGARALVAHGKLTVDRDFAAESLAATLTPRSFLTVVRGEILRVDDQYFVITRTGRRLRLTATAPMEGTEGLRFIERLDDAACGPDVVIAGVEVNGELRVFARR